MLVISRQRDEDVVIVVPPSETPTEIRVALVDLRGDKARLGFLAPRQVQIDRLELHEAKRRANAAAAQRAG